MDTESAVFIEWKDSDATGIEEIDKQHKKLFKLTNQLHISSLSVETQREAFTSALHESVDYVQQHFKYEEEFLSRIGYPNLAAHQKMHKAFVQQVITTAQEYKSGQQERSSIVVFDFVRFLRDWILSHILVNDMEWARWAKANHKVE
jgi:hemerythrin-like metal-binding protein